MSVLQNNITPTSELALKSDYHLFKRGVRPEWEVRLRLRRRPFELITAANRASIIGSS